LTGVYVFDTFLSEVRKLLKPHFIYVYFQYHDEFLFEYNPLKIDKNVLLNILEKAMENTNNSLKLNIQINFSAQFGDNYADCH
jgi:DNA polymerase I-like protein with 3'-5' exonuclease and polymerase domains